MTSSICSGSFDDIRRPVSFRSIICRAGASLALQPELGGRDQPLGDGKQPDLAIAIPAAIDGNGF